MGAFERARDELYGLDPEAFMARRGELVAAARNAGDATVAKRIGALRKPTRSAYAVNLLVRARPDAADRLAELGDQLRDAQQQLDGAAIRELSTRRNKLVDELTRAALTTAGNGVPASLRDDVANTITAAIADPEVLDRFRAGALVRPERWDGMGVAATPALRLVRGAKDDRAGGQPARSGRAGTAGAEAEPEVEGEGDVEGEAEGAGVTVSARAAADQRAQARAQARIDAAAAALAQAEEELDAAAAAHAEQRRTVRQLEDALDGARRRLDAAEHDLHRARQRAERARAALKRRTDA